MDPPAWKEKPKVKEPVSSGEGQAEVSPAGMGADREQKSVPSRVTTGLGHLGSSLVASGNRRSLLESEPALRPHQMGPWRLSCECYQSQAKTAH